MLSKVGSRLGLAPNSYGIVTLHRPTNVDNRRTLELLLRELGKLSTELPLVFPVHPRTRKALDLITPDSRIVLLNPLGYIDFMSLVKNAALVITRSPRCAGGNELSRHPVPHGTRHYRAPDHAEAWNQPPVRGDQIANVALEVLKSGRPLRPAIPLWDGASAERMVRSLKERALADNVA